MCLVADFASFSVEAALRAACVLLTAMIAGHLLACASPLDVSQIRALSAVDVFLTACRWQVCQLVQLYAGVCRWYFTLFAAWDQVLTGLTASVRHEVTFITTTASCFLVSVLVLSSISTLANSIVYSQEITCALNALVSWPALHATWYCWATR